MFGAIVFVLCVSLFWFNAWAGLLGLFVVLFDAYHERQDRLWWRSIDTEPSREW